MSSLACLSVEGQLQSISYCLEQPQANYNEIGLITNEGYINHYIRGIWTHNNKPRLIHLIKFVNNAFSLIEQKGVKVFSSTLQSVELDAAKEAYRRRNAIYFRVAANIHKEAARLKAINDPEMKRVLHILKSFEVALRYNLGSDSGGVNGWDALQQPDPECLTLLCQLAITWKKKQPACLNSELNELELKELKTAARYPKWVDHLKENSAYQNEFMKWTIRDYNPPEIFIKYFAMQGKIKAALLPTYLGYSRETENETLAIKKVATQIDGIMKKVLCLPFYDGDFKFFEAHKQKWVNILKPNNLIHFEKGNYLMSVEEFMKLNQQKDLHEVNVNLAANWGYVNFHPIHGVWNAERRTYETPPSESDDWTADNWVDKIPPMRIASQEEIEAKYGDKLKDKKMFYQVRSTRTELNLKTLGCHGFMQLYLAMGNGKWKVLNVGTYGERFQQNLWEAICILGDTMKGVFALIDQNGVYTHRQRAAYSIFPTEEKKKEMLDKLYDTHLRSQRVFQQGARNCAYGIQTCVNSVLDTPINFYRMRISRCTTGIALLDTMLSWADKQSEWLSNLIIFFIHKILGSHRDEKIIEKEGLTSYSMAEFLSKNPNVIYNPAYMIHQIIEAKKAKSGDLVDGELYWGNTEERLPVKN